MYPPGKTPSAPSISCMEATEARQMLLLEQLEKLNPALVIFNLTQEEDEGGVSGLIFLALVTPLVSEPQEIGGETHAWIELIEELDNLLVNFTHYEESTNGEHSNGAFCLGAGVLDRLWVINK